MVTHFSLLATSFLTIMLTGPVKGQTAVEVQKKKAEAMLDLYRNLDSKTDLPAKKDGSCCYEDMAKAKEAAAKSNKTLLVWVGGCDKSLDVPKEFGNCINVHAKEWGGSSTPRLIFPTSANNYFTWDQGKIDPEIVRQVTQKYKPSAVTPVNVNWMAVQPTQKQTAVICTT